jgi:hypothetical protein
MNIEFYYNNLKFIHPHPSGLVGRDAENCQKQKALSKFANFYFYFMIITKLKKERKKERTTHPGCDG